MGDRGNIAVIQSNGDQVWLYSHWGGYDLPSRLQEGLSAGKGRWTDESYLTKIIFGHVVPLDNWRDECGYGISGCLQDNEHPILCVDCEHLRVFTVQQSTLKRGKVPAKPVIDKGPWKFEEYCALKNLPWGDREKEAV